MIAYSTTYDSETTTPGCTCYVDGWTHSHCNVHRPLPIEPLPPKQDEDAEPFIPFPEYCAPRPWLAKKPWLASEQCLSPPKQPPNFNRRSFNRGKTRRRFTYSQIMRAIRMKRNALR